MTGKRQYPQEMKVSQEKEGVCWRCGSTNTHKLSNQYGKAHYLCKGCSHAFTFPATLHRQAGRRSTNTKYKMGHRATSCDLHIYPLKDCEACKQRRHAWTIAYSAKYPERVRKWARDYYYRHRHELYIPARRSVEERNAINSSFT